MRQIGVNRISFLLAALLVAAVALFAWLRSNSVTLVIQTSGSVVSGERRELGGSVYAGRCSACHESLTHIPELFRAAGGRSYLVEFLLFGYEGEIIIDGNQRRLRHPPFADLTDDEIAAVANHVLLSWGNAEELGNQVEPFLASEVEAARERQRSAAEVAERRPVR